jgi:hypothetical protein
LACFEVLKMRMFERFDGSEPRVRAFASKLAKIPGFRTIPGSPFLWILSFGEAKESISPQRAKALLGKLAAKANNDIKVNHAGGKANVRSWYIARSNAKARSSTC